MVRPTVFHPRILPSSEFFAAFVARLDLAGRRVADVGTGSGIIALAAARAGAASVVAVDINPNAVCVAIENASVNGLDGRVMAVCCDLLSALAPRVLFDVILSDPPYFPAEPLDIADRAWNAGPAYRDIAPLFEQAQTRLAPGGRMYLDDRFHETGRYGTGDLFVDSPFGFDRTRNGIMAGWRQVIELAMTDEEIGRLAVIAHSRSESASRVKRAQMLLAYRQKPSFFAVGQELGQHHQTVQRCVERALAYGPLAALDDRPRPGKEPTITLEAKAWLISLACDKAREHGYPHELWTTRLLARHAREHGPAAGHDCLANLVQGTVCKILGQQDIKPHKVRYYLENRDAEFEQKMAEVLCVYREVHVLKKAAAKPGKPSPTCAVGAQF